MPVPRFQAKLKLLTSDEGGRQRPLWPGCRTQFHFGDDTEGWAIQIESCNPDPFAPGEEGAIEFIAVSWEVIQSRLTAGTRFRLQEGFRIIAHGEISSSA